MGGKKEIYRDVQFFHGAIQMLLPFHRIVREWLNNLLRNPVY